MAASCRPARTFLVFTDYARPAMRIAALAGIPVVYVMTHDSIGLGEDGPTHQPVEHLAALRAMPKMRVFRPADAVETAECWQLALERTDGPTALALTRQTPAAGPQGRRPKTSRPRAPTSCPRPRARPRATIFASGLRGRDRARGPEAPPGTKLRRSRCLGAVARPLPGPARERPRPHHRRCAGQGRGRGRGPLRLGRGHRPDGIFVGMNGFRRERAL